MTFNTTFFTFLTDFFVAFWFRVVVFDYSFKVYILDISSVFYFFYCTTNCDNAFDWLVNHCFRRQRLTNFLTIQFSDLVSLFNRTILTSLIFKLISLRFCWVRSDLSFVFNSFFLSNSFKCFCRCTNQNDFSRRLLNYFLRFNLTTYNCITNFGNLININFLTRYTFLYSFLKSDRKFICLTSFDDVLCRCCCTKCFNRFITNDIYWS